MSAGHLLGDVVMELAVFALLYGLSYGLLVFMLSAGLTLIFSMMGVLSFAQGSFYMLGAYFAYAISIKFGFWQALLIAPGTRGSPRRPDRAIRATVSAQVRPRA